MSWYEKIASVLMGAFILVIIIFSYHEIKEPEQHHLGGLFSSDFDSSRGQEFKIGSFATTTTERVSDSMEQDCAELEPVIIAVLHDIRTRLEKQPGEITLHSGDAFEINERSIQLFCHTNAEVTLSDDHGNALILSKAPFVRAIPPQGTAVDIGTEVRITATIVPSGKPKPLHPTTYGDILIPDRFLDISTSTTTRP